jgi:hypothetical protein
MRPSRDQIAVAAYHRWHRRGGEHGRDRADWIAAETDLLFALNYETIARYPLNRGPGRILGDSTRRRCRFCEQSSPRTSFERSPRLVPAILGETTLVVGDECDACHDQFQEQLTKPFEAFARPFLTDAAATDPSWPGSSIPVSAYKFLVKTALTIMPEDELPSFGDTIEWVCNTNHRQDFRVLRGLSCRVYLTALPAAALWASLARRIEDDAPFPAMLFFVCTPRAAFQVSLPLGIRDDEIDGEALHVPTLSSSIDPASHLGTIPCLDLPISASN